MRKTAPCYSAEDYYGFFDVTVGDKSILDIGSSIGSFKKSDRFDSSEKNLAEARRYLTLDIDPRSGADVVSDAHELPFKEAEFDIIIANNVIEHFHTPSRAVSEMRRTLKDGGTIFYTIPFMYPVHEAPHDYVRLTRFGLEKLFGDFKEVEIHERGGMFSTTAHFFYKTSHQFDQFRLGGVLRLLMYPILWLWVQLDRFDKSNAFVRVYYGKMRK